jgi:acyl carrier protein
VSRADNRQRLLRFLESIRRPDRWISEIQEEENLVGAGLIDSLALLEIVAFLEAEFGIDFSETGLDPARLTTIPSILDIIELQGG